MLYQRPDLLHRILEVNARAVTDYLNAQIDAGAQAVMIFDSWGGVLADGAFQSFSLAYTARVLAQLKTTSKDANGATVRIPRIVFTKGGGLWLQEMAALDCEVLGLDWTVNLGKARELVGGQENGPGKALQGNIDPNVLFAPPAHIATEVARVLDSFGKPFMGSGTGPTHIFNLGHGISQYTPPEHVAALVEAVHNHSRKMRA
jgi:uroporphyrinogen decarboxylase